jgi:hypothetical protein
MHVILNQQKCVEALKGETLMLENLNTIIEDQDD